MESESVHTARSLDSMAETLKELVQDSSDWMRRIQSLPIEEAEAEYSRSSVNGDAVLKKLQQSYEDQQEKGGYLQDWAVQESHGLWGPMMKQPTAVEMLIVHVLGMMTGFRFINQARSCELTDEADLATLRHCAHSPDVRFLTSCGFGISRWPAEMSFRTGIESAAFFADQCCFFTSDIKVTHIQRPYWSDECEQSGHSCQEAIQRDRDYSFTELLDLCKEDRRYAQKCLFPCVCIEHLQMVIDYETAWLKHAFCNSPQPRPLALEKEQWLTDRDASRVVTSTVAAMPPHTPEVTHALLGMNVIEAAEKITITRFVRHLGRKLSCSITEDNQKAVFRKIMAGNGKISQKDFLQLVPGRGSQNNTRDRLRSALEKIQIRLPLVAGNYVLEAVE